jgi:hypothetical protein
MDVTIAVIKQQSHRHKGNHCIGTSTQASYIYTARLYLPVALVKDWISGCIVAGSQQKNYANGLQYFI